jgi:hypothetical protein
MSNTLAISPSVMINRLVDRAGTPPAAQLTKVAALRMELRAKAEAEQNKADLLHPEGDAGAPIIDSGAAVDR